MIIPLSISQTQWLKEGYWYEDLEESVCVCVCLKKHTLVSEAKADYVYQR